MILLFKEINTILKNIVDNFKYLPFLSVVCWNDGPLSSSSAI